MLRRFFLVCITSVYLVASTGETLAAIFPGLGTGQKHRQQGEQHRTKEDHRRSADGGDACIQLDGVQDNRHQNSADAVAQQQPRRNADQTKQKCLLANDAFELPGRCANGFQKSVKPDIPCNRDLKNVIDDKIPRENHQQQKAAMAIISSGSSCDSSWDEVYPQLTPIRTLLGSV